MTEGRATKRRTTARSLLAPVMLVSLLTAAAGGCTGSSDAPTPPTGSDSSPAAPPPQVQVRDDLVEVFGKAGTEGTFAFYSANDNRLVLVDRERAEQPMTPASTFKIPHSLIALQTGVVNDVDEPIPYGGKPQPFEEWEQDMGLRDAVQVSNVAIFQEIARRIGADREGEWMRRLDYGNFQVGSTVDEFWLNGALRISAQDQARWLCRLARQDLPVSTKIQSLVRDIVRLEKIGDATLYGKTGTAMRTSPTLGWWVGWVERGDNLYCFALNMDTVEVTSNDQRIALGKELLRRLGALPAAESPLSRPSASTTPAR